MRMTILLLALRSRRRFNAVLSGIFFDAAGKERFRHEGFFSKQDILAKWKELGVALNKAL